jgi:hypothetical protein
MSMIALVDQRAGDARQGDGAIDRVVVAVIHLRALAGADDPIALVEIGDALRQRRQRDGIGDDLKNSFAELGTNILNVGANFYGTTSNSLNDQAAGISALIAELEKDYPNYIRNFYFDIQVEGEEMHFDYKLKPGECKTFNASLLLKRIGIYPEKE